MSGHRLRWLWRELLEPATRRQVRTMKKYVVGRKWTLLKHLHHSERNPKTCGT